MSKHIDLREMLIISVLINCILGFTMIFATTQMQDTFDRLLDCQEELQSYKETEKKEGAIHNTLLDGYKVSGINTEALTDYISEASLQYHVDPKLIMAQISAESSFKATAVSNVGARGLMQIMPFWVRDEDFRQATGIFHSDQLFNPRKNIMAGTYIIAHYIKRCGGIEKGLACYHGGLRAIKRPKPVTRSYVKKVMRRYMTI